MKQLDEMTIEELCFLSSHAIIEKELVDEELMRRTVQSIKEKYHIWQASDGRWKTHLYVDGKRKLIAKSTEADLILFLKALERNESLISISFDECFSKFRDLRAETVDVNTIEKYRAEYKRHFAGTDFAAKMISDITRDDILIFIARTIKHPKFRGKPSERPLTVRSAKSLWYMVYDTFTFAVEHGFLPEGKNPCARLDFKRYFFKLTEDIERPMDKIIVPPEQIRKLNEQYRIDHEKNPYYIPTYAVELASLTGMRVGEVAALRWDHILDDYIKVDRYDSQDKSTGELRIKKRPKNQKVRYIPITQDIQDLLDTVHRVEEEKGWLCEYVFADQNGRFRGQVICSCLKNKCRQAGVSSKGINAYRRTVNSLMRENGLSAQAASSVLGNTVLVNNEFYTFDISSADEKKASLAKANAYMLAGKEKNGPGTV